IGTRTGTLVVVLVVYALSTSADGTFDTRRYRLWALFWLSIAILGPMIWVESGILQTFVRNYEKVITYSSIALMVLFVVKGQLQVAKVLFRHFMDGNYSIKRFSLQVVRFFGFFFQAIHYWIVPTSAKPFFGFDPIFLQGALGAGGVLMVLGGSLIGFIRGSDRRHRKQQARKLALAQVTPTAG